MILGAKNIEKWRRAKGIYEGEYLITQGEPTSLSVAPI